MTKHKWDAEWGTAYCEVCRARRTPMNDAADDCPGMLKHDWLSNDQKLTHCARCEHIYYPWALDKECKPPQKLSIDLTPAETAELIRVSARLPELFPGERSHYPVFTGLLMYFPNACAEVAKVSRTCNEQHNPGEPIHWAKDKSIGDGNQALRHFMQAGTRDRDGERHSAKAAWRMLEFLEREILAEQAAAGAGEAVQAVPAARCTCNAAMQYPKPCPIHG